MFRKYITLSFLLIFLAGRGGGGGGGVTRQGSRDGHTFCFQSFYFKYYLCSSNIQNWNLLRLMCVYVYILSPPYIIYIYNYTTTTIPQGRITFIYTFTTTIPQGRITFIYTFTTTIPQGRITILYLYPWGHLDDTIVVDHWPHTIYMT